MKTDYHTCKVEFAGQVATITIVPPMELVGGTADLHWDLGEIFGDLRGENDIRVVVLTGWPGAFYTPHTPEFYDNAELRSYVTDPPGSWKTFTGVLRTHQGIAELEKPVIGKISGDAIGFGSSLAFACDLIVSVDDARFADVHLAMGELGCGPRFGIAAGDGGASLIPLFMTPAKAKEYLFLAKAYTGKELADAGIINYAVPAAKLDATVDDLVRQLLARSAFALAWTKRVANRHVIDQLNKTLDASAAYEMVNFLQIERLDGVDPLSLT